MKVYSADGDGFPRLVGRADVPADHDGPFLEVRLFGAASTFAEYFSIGPLTRVTPPYDAGSGERVVLLRPGQLRELLPGWRALAA